MTARVRLSVFAGRPNPEWTIADSAGDDLVVKIDALPLTQGIAPAVVSWGQFGRPRIGYSGITLTLENNRSPYSATVFDGFVDLAGSGDHRADHSRELERRLYATAPPDVLQLLDNMTFEQLTDRGNESLIKGLNPSAASQMICETGPSSRNSEWIARKEFNNCYNFANDTLNTSSSAAAMPGSLRELPHGQHTAQLSKLLQDEIEKDGPEPIGGHAVPGACPTGGFHYMAVILLHLPGSSVVDDFHCLRLDTDGTWWHKSGVQEPRNTDDSGGGPQVITDLAKAIFAGKPALVGLYRAKKNNPKIK